MSFASAGGAISVTTLADHNTERAHPPARGFASRRRRRLCRRQFRRVERRVVSPERKQQDATQSPGQGDHRDADRKSTRLNSSHRCSSYAVFCLKKKNNRTACSTTLY